MYRCLSSPDFKAAPPASPPACLIKEVTKVKEEGTTFFCRLFSRACCNGSSRKRPLGKFRRQKSAAPPYFVAWNSSMLFLGWGKFPTFCFLPPWIKFKRNSEMAASSSKLRRENMRVQYTVADSNIVQSHFCAPSSLLPAGRFPLLPLTFFCGKLSRVCLLPLVNFCPLFHPFESVAEIERQPAVEDAKKRVLKRSQEKKVVCVTNREKRKKSR